MPIMNLLPNGISGGFPGPGAQPGTAKRSTIRGWSVGSSRRLVSFLWSVNTADLEGVTGFALTLTMGGTPERASDWAAARKAFIERLRWSGVDRLFWLTEWTRKGRPHMHLAIYGPPGIEHVAQSAWLEIALARGWPTRMRAQTCEELYGVAGWLQYCGKHAARGVQHYQRQSASIPAGWLVTGRLWGKSGVWPVEAREEFLLDDVQFWRYRRLVKAWQVSRMSIQRGISSARADRKIGVRYRLPEGSARMGVSAWVPGPVAYRLLGVATGGTFEPSEEWKNIHVI